VQRKVIALFHFALNQGGHLFLGPSESVGQHTDLFETVSKKWRSFRRSGATRRNIVEFPIGSGYQRPAPAGGPLELPVARPEGLAELARRVLLEDYAAAAVLVNTKYEVLYFFGSTMRFLDLPTGEPTRDLMRLTREGLGAKLRAACHKALRDQVPVLVDNASVKRNGTIVAVESRVKPLRGPDSGERLLLVTFADAPQGAKAEAGAVQPGETMDEASLVQQLEQELKVTREDLQSTIEELESSSEELKASNEEKRCP